MKPAKPNHPFALHVLAAALCAAGMAQATEIATGNPDLAVRFDNTIKYNYGHRLSSQDASLLKSANFDDGDRNFDKGMVSNRIDWLSELDVVFDKRIGMRMSAAAWFDGAQQHEGSWWPDWRKWVGAYVEREVPARVPGKGKLPVLEAAPGSYARLRADDSEE